MVSVAWDIFPWNVGGIFLAILQPVIGLLAVAESEQAIGYEYTRVVATGLIFSELLIIMPHAIALDYTHKQE